MIIQCPKCHSQCDSSQTTASIEQIYDAQNKRWSDSKRIVNATITTTFVKLPENSKCFCSIVEEHLHRRCNICNYYWPEELLG